MDIVHERAAGMDISKHDAKVCARVPGGQRGRFTSTVTTWGSTTNQILQLRRITYWSLPFVIVFGVWNLIPNIPLPWRVAMLAVETVFVIAFGTAVIRFSLWQRDEYWRERGRDPKHPDRFPKDRPDNGPASGPGEDTPAAFHRTVGAREDDGVMTAPTVEAAIHELMDLAWNVVYDLLEERGLLGDGLEVQEYTGIHSWVENLTRYTVVHSRAVAVLFVDTRPVDAIVFHHDLLGADDPKSYFRLQM